MPLQRDQVLRSGCRICRNESTHALAAEFSSKRDCIPERPRGRRRTGWRLDLLQDTGDCEQFDLDWRLILTLFDSVIGTTTWGLACTLYEDDKDQTFEKQLCNSTSILPVPLHSVLLVHSATG